MVYYYHSVKGLNRNIPSLLLRKIFYRAQYQKKTLIRNIMEFLIAQTSHYSEITALLSIKIQIQ